jgi:hypothetical protein
MYKFILYFRLGDKSLKISVNLVLCFQYAIAMVMAAAIVLLFGGSQNHNSKK